MRTTKHWLMTIAALLCSMAVSAHDFEVGGIYYNITSAEDLTVAVTFRGEYWHSYTNEYSGSVAIPEAITYNGSTYSVASIGEDAFYNCSTLTAVTLPESVTVIGDFAFHGCSRLTTITLPEGVTEIGIYAFEGCSKLTTINIPEGVTSIEEWVFNECENLTTITLPKDLTSIGDYAFNYCSKLTTINIPERVTVIGNHAFRGCSRLTSITLPESVTNIGSQAFNECSRLTSITCKPATPPTTGSLTFYKVDKTIPVYVPASSVAAYQSAEGWSEFTNIQALPAPDEISITLNQYGSSTYCSEYALDFSEVQGLKAYAATGYNTKTGIVTLTRVMTSQPDMGLFLKGAPGEYTVPTLESTDDNSLNMLVGLTENTTITATSDDGLYYNFRYTIKSGEESPLFYRVEEAGFTLNAGKAYLQIPAAWMPVAETRSIGLRFDDEDATDIEDVELGTQHSEQIYDLMGRRVAQPQKGGVYVVNGKKTIIK